jgi:hypothetical protein
MLLISCMATFLPLQGPFKGEVRRGMGASLCTAFPYPHPVPPLEGEGEFPESWEKVIRQ